MVHPIHPCTVHVFRGELCVSLEQLQLLEGQDTGLVSLEELLNRIICSDPRSERRAIERGRKCISACHRLSISQPSPLFRSSGLGTGESWPLIASGDC